MTQARSLQKEAPAIETTRRSHRSTAVAAGGDAPRMTEKLVSEAFEADRGIAKAHAFRLFQRVAATSPQPVGKIRAELIPDSSWKRAGKTLGPQASQTTARLRHILTLAETLLGNES